MAINYVDNSVAATKGEGWTPVAEFKSKGNEVVNKGVKYEIVSREERNVSLIKRISVTFLTCITLGLVLINDTMRNAFFGKEVVDFAVPADVLKAERAAAAPKPTTVQTLKDKVAALKNKAVAFKDESITFCKKNPGKVVLGLTGVATAVGLSYYTGASLLPVNITNATANVTNATANATARVINATTNATVKLINEAANATVCLIQQFANATHHGRFIS